MDIERLMALCKAVSELDVMKVYVEGESIVLVDTRLPEEIRDAVVSELNDAIGAVARRWMCICKGKIKQEVNKSAEGDV